MWGTILLLSLVNTGLAEQEVHKRRLANNIAVETVKLLDFHDVTVIDNLVKSVVETESEELVGQIMHMLSDPAMAGSNKKLRAGLKKMVQDPKHLKEQKKKKKEFPLAKGIIKLLKANMSVEEKKNVLEKVSEKMDKLHSLSKADLFEQINEIPREARFTNDDFPYESLLKGGNSKKGKHDLSNCEVQSDGSCCITKVTLLMLSMLPLLFLWQVQDNAVLEKEDIKECWHKNVTTCYDSYVTEFTSAEDEECEDVFYKNCVIDFKQVPFDYEVKSCHTPMVKVGR